MNDAVLKGSCFSSGEYRSYLLQDRITVTGIDHAVPEVRVCVILICCITGHGKAAFSMFCGVRSAVLKRYSVNVIRDRTDEPPVPLFALLQCDIGLFCLCDVQEHCQF